MTYRVILSPEADRDMYLLAKSEPAAFKKVEKLIEELKEHPMTGTGHPEPLRGNRAGDWSRRISKKHRLVYRVYETAVLVLVVAAYGHYDDK